MKQINKAMLASYARSVVAAVTAVYLTGNTDPADLGKAALAALLPVIARYVNPKDLAFGRTTD